MKASRKAGKLIDAFERAVLGAGRELASIEKKRARAALERYIRQMEQRIEAGV